MLDLNAIFDPAQVEARNEARYSLAAGSQTQGPGTPTHAQEVAALIDGVEDDTHQVALRDRHREHLAACAHDGEMTEAQAERSAVEEIPDLVAA